MKTRHTLLSFHSYPLYGASRIPRPDLCPVCRSSGRGKGESEEILLEFGAGITILPEDVAALAQAVVTLADDPARCAALGKKGCVFAAEKFSREILARRMLDEMLRLGAK